MPRIFRFYAFAIILASTLISCSEKKESPSVSFYFWRTNLNLSETEKEALHHFNTNELFLRFFDLDKTGDSIVTLGEIQGLDKIPDSVSVISVVFITNRTFIDLSEEKTIALSKKVFEKIQTSLSASNIVSNSLQFDCDWSDKTREMYFLFLSEIKNLLAKKCSLSCTIRLHQVKYAKITGVPPVDEGVLMFYNMGNIKDKTQPNSIYNKNDAEKYVRYIRSYPLPLSVALPLFSWTAQYREGKLINLIAKSNIAESVEKSKIKETENGGRFKIISSFLQSGNYFMEGDELKIEKLSTEELVEATTMIAANLPDKKINILFYDLDEYNLKSHSYEDLEKILAPFN